MPAGYMLLVIKQLTPFIQWRFQLLANNLGKVYQLSLFGYFREELKQRMGGGICPGKPPQDLSRLQFYFPSLYYTLQILCCFQAEALWKLGSSKLINAIFFQQLLLIVCLCHILVIFVVFQAFSLLLYLLWWSAIFFRYFCKFFVILNCHSLFLNRHKVMASPTRWT